MEIPEPPSRFQFGLVAMFVLVAIIASVIAATKAFNALVGMGVAMLTVGYWLILRAERTNAGLHYAGWVLAIIGIGQILVGALDDAVQ